MSRIFRFYSKPDGTDVRVTVVGEFDSSDHTLSIATSRCSEKDSFNKKKGRAIAEGRLRKGKLNKISSFPDKEDISLSEFLDVAKTVAADVANNRHNVKIDLFER